jgi:hypothetical protein
MSSFIGQSLLNSPFSFEFNLILRLTAIIFLIKTLIIWAPLGRLVLARALILVL